MASATGVPDVHPEALGRGEDEPLLGRAGDASQQDGSALQWNLVLGTAVIAQAGIWILVGIVWGSVLSKPVILFSAHPLLNSAGLLLLTQGALILQPTHTASQKRSGTLTHFIVNDLGLLLLLGGLIVIETNKQLNSLPHLESAHAILGLLTYALLAVQALVGFTQYFTPQLYGGVDRAKRVWKYHRASGYLVFVLALATVASATQTTFNRKVLGIQLWAVLVAAAITLAGVLPRVKKQKLGLA
ncbi:uncharacterized protein K452DRAFT_282321 [Aplosporella prunicola CBS 121167]|uniref:Cytochrome b561 domain-containing protein n=1 Tax=Aplosporella prunicola CBS 121167 TaxID=1176127 RepID=A0A6A6BT97_9PEZI|nr:uncharacterized protein K452DRAFT_282321 [Aplosporella prunicola CBS 121167]KAF2147316.1 hypothetical protein K452DRAFT_282321 [Aplosporella prunicola CBS 121167]